MRCWESWLGRASHMFLCAVIGSHHESWQALPQAAAQLEQARRSKTGFWGTTGLRREGCLQCEPARRGTKAMGTFRHPQRAATPHRYYIYIVLAKVRMEARMVQLLSRFSALYTGIVFRPDFYLARCPEGTLMKILRPP
jgi:hypothetical protein